jgi:hypothetical protein
MARSASLRVHTPTPLETLVEVAKVEKVRARALLPRWRCSIAVGVDQRSRSRATPGNRQSGSNCQPRNGAAALGKRSTRRFLSGPERSSRLSGGKRSASRHFSAPKPGWSPRFVNGAPTSTLARVGVAQTYKSKNVSLETKVTDASFRPDYGTARQGTTGLVHHIKVQYSVG